MRTSLKKAWTTHMSTLVKTLQCSEGDVVELGVGPFSTPLLHWICKEMGRKLYSYEDDVEYYEYAKQFQSPGHKITLVKSFDEVNADKHVGMVFVDHHPSERRVVDVIRFKDTADYIVIHDTEPSKEWCYGFEKGFEQFKYVYHWDKCVPWVSVASNTKTLENFK